LNQAAVRAGTVVLLAFLLGPFQQARAEERTTFVRSVLVEHGETQQGDVVVCFGNVVVRGTVEGDVVVVGGNVEVEGTVKEDVIVAGGAVRVRKGGRLDVDAIAVGGPVEVEEGGVIAGKIVNKPWLHIAGQRGVFWRGAVAMTGFNLFVALLGYALVRRQRIENMAATLRAWPWSSLFAGLGVALIVSGLYNLTTLIPSDDAAEWVGWGVTALVAAVCAAGFVGICRAVGARFAGEGNVLTSVLLGSLAASAAIMVPLAGCVVFFLGLVLAAGVCMVSRFGSVELKTQN
jgi:hypothetical protein